MSTAIKVENLGKQYRLGEVGTGTLSHDLNRWWAKARGKEDPFARIGEINDRTIKGESEYVWALKNVDFEVKSGEVLGIIGRNGAGKSTLLKLLSKVTKPSEGRILTKGRIASLLEVGTGFHPEMTGRENIYLNGAIMGMTRMEIKSKFDEIVDFAGVDRYVDTPVKRYSSGMYVRLAFAVAAHLNAEVLVIDEVLAVGDAEFQRKCLGKMSDVSKMEGRTVLFVSHNMTSIQSLCSHSILLHQGTLKAEGPTARMINEYIFSKSKNETLSHVQERKGNGNFKFTSGHIYGDGGMSSSVETFSAMNMQIGFALNTSNVRSYRIDIGINNYLGDRIAWLSTDTLGSKIDLSAGTIQFVINRLPISPGTYRCTLYCEINNEIADWVSDVLEFTIIEKDYYGFGKTLPPNQGNILLDFKII